MKYKFQLGDLVKVRLTEQIGLIIGRPTRRHLVRWTQDSDKNRYTILIGGTVSLPMRGEDLIKVGYRGE